MLVRGVLRLGGLGVVEFDTEVGNIVLHCETASVLDVVPLKIDARLQISFPIFSNFVVFFKDRLEVKSMVFA